VSTAGYSRSTGIPLPVDGSACADVGLRARVGGYVASTGTLTVIVLPGQSR
jgi:hypothetical protein